MNIDQMIAVLQDYKNGKNIQYKSGDEWKDCSVTPSFNFNGGMCEYRAKPEPREFTVSVDDRGKLIGIGYADAESVWVLPGRASAGPGKFIKVREVLE